MFNDLRMIKSLEARLKNYMYTTLGSIQMDGKIQDVLKKGSSSIKLLATYVMIRSKNGLKKGRSSRGGGGYSP